MSAGYLTYAERQRRMKELAEKEELSCIVKNQFLREDLMKVAQDWQIPKIMKILKDHGLVSGD